MDKQSFRRRSFLKGALAGLAAAAMGPAVGAAPGRKMNVCFLFIDDLRPDALGALGNPVVQTPNLDSIINRGCIFRRAYTMGAMVGAVCLPSRTMVLTGQSLFHAENAASGDDPNTFTFPRAMDEAGYATVHAGKFGNSPKKITEEFDESTDPGNAKNVVDDIVDFIHRRSDDPLYIYMAGPEPHDPQYATDDYYAMYDPKDIPLPETFAPYHPFDNGDIVVRDEMTLPFPRTPEAVRGKLARYYASISYLDAQFGRVLDALREEGEFDNTLFVIAGDNGLSLGDHGLLGKQNLYEYGGMHVPLVFAGRGIEHSETDALAYLMDIFPTVCDLTGIPTPDRVDGKSLVPVISRGDDAVRDWLYTAYKDVQRSVTDGRWKLIRYPKIDKTQLFDLDNDPRERNDLAGDAEHADRLDAMMKMLAELQESYDDPVPLVVDGPKPAAWSPEQLTPEQIQYQIEETARCLGSGRM